MSVLTSIHNSILSKENPQFEERKGIIFIILAGCIWGLNGVCGQYILQEKGVDPQWMITVRQIVAGIVLLFFAYRKIGNAIFDLWKRKKDAFRLCIFSVLGIMGSQLCYFCAIKYSNAATATVLQYLFPIFVAIAITIHFRKLPSIHLIFSIFLALFGVFLLVTNGRIDKLSLSVTALVWGLISAVASTLYTLLPIPLLQKYQTTTVVGWGMFVGGIALNFSHPFWQPVGIFDFSTFVCLIFIILFGGLIGFFLYLTGVKLIGGGKGSVLATIEPLSAAVFSVLILNVPFSLIDWIGSACILITIVILAPKKI